MIDGTRQGQRSLEVMESRRFPVDATPLDQLVALCARLSRHLRFVDLNNLSVGDWQGLFERDESLVEVAGLGIVSPPVMDRRSPQTGRREENDLVHEIGGDALVPAQRLFVAADRLE